MLTPESVRAQIERLTGDLIGISLSKYQNYPSIREMGPGVTEIGFRNGIGIDTVGLSIVMKNLPYQKIYDVLDHEQMYNVKMVDGALIQLMYRFRNGNIESHRLAFFPSPYLEEYQNNPKVYDEDEMFAEIIARSIVPFPFRFDFDSRDEVTEALHHPQSHLSLGQYKHCRIPVSAAVTPYYFVSFVLRNFYNPAYRTFCDDLTTFTSCFSDCILECEQDIVHVKIPAGH